MGWLLGWASLLLSCSSFSFLFSLSFLFFSPAIVLLIPRTSFRTVPKLHGSRSTSRINNLMSRPKGRDSRDLSSSSDDQNDGKHQLEKTIQMREDLENEVNQMKDKVAAKEQQITDLQKKAQKLEDELVAARKVSAERQLAVTDLYKHFLQLQDYNDRVKTAEQKLQSLVDAAMVELDMADDGTTKDGSMYENGVV